MKVRAKYRSERNYCEAAMTKLYKIWFSADDEVIVWQTDFDPACDTNLSKMWLTFTKEEAIRIAYSLLSQCQSESDRPDLDAWSPNMLLMPAKPL